MSSLAVRAYRKLIRFEFELKKGNFESIYERIRKQPVKSCRPGVSVQEVSTAVERACMWYWKRVLCLQRSAVTTSLMREQGIPAVMVIGAQLVPFRAHAWVEVGGVPVDHRAGGYENYSILDRY